MVNDDGRFAVRTSLPLAVFWLVQCRHGASPTVHAMALRKVGPKAGDRFRDCPERTLGGEPRGRVALSVVSVDIDTGRSIVKPWRGRIGFLTA